MKHLIAAVAIALLATVAASAQSNPVTDTVHRMERADMHKLVASANFMPASKYSYRPTEKQWTFGHLMFHAGMANYFMCSKIAGTAMPHHADVSPTSSKAELVTNLRASFEYCLGVLAKANDSELSQPIHLFGPHEVPKAAAMVGLVTDQADHYATASGYLRLNGILPPTARPHRHSMHKE